MLAESARAVDKEIVGRESEALLIGGVAELRNACSCALLAANSAAAALWASCLLLGEVKNCAILLALAEVVLTNPGPLSLGERDGHGVGGELLRKGFDNRRGMAEDLEGSERMLCSSNDAQRLRYAMCDMVSQSYSGAAWLWRCREA